MASPRNLSISFEKDNSVLVLKDQTGRILKGFYLYSQPEAAIPYAWGVYLPSSNKGKGYDLTPPAKNKKNIVVNKWLRKKFDSATKENRVVLTRSFIDVLRETQGLSLEEISQIDISKVETILSKLTFQQATKIDQSFPFVSSSPVPSPSFAAFASTTAALGVPFTHLGRPKASSSVPSIQPPSIPDTRSPLQGIADDDQRADQQQQQRQQLKQLKVAEEKRTTQLFLNWLQLIVESMALNYDEKHWVSKHFKSAEQQFDLGGFKEIFISSTPPERKIERVLEKFKNYIVTFAANEKNKGIIKTATEAKAKKTSPGSDLFGRDHIKARMAAKAFRQINEYCKNNAVLSPYKTLFDNAVFFIKDTLNLIAYVEEKSKKNIDQRCLTLATNLQIAPDETGRVNSELQETASQLGKKHLPKQQKKNVDVEAALKLSNLSLQ